MRYFSSPHHQAVAFALILAVAMLAPGGAVPRVPTFDWVDKALHFALFLVMTVLLTRSLRASGRFHRPALAAATFALVYAALLETLQALIPGRSCDPADLVANALGVLAALPLQSMAKRG